MKKIVVGCDLYLKEFMYSLPNNFKNKIIKNFPNIKFIPINTPNNISGNDKVEIYWGNRIDKKIFNLCPNIRWVHFGSVGVDRLDKLNTKRKLIVTNSSQVMNEAMVATILSYIFSLSRGLNFLFLDKINKTLSRSKYDTYKNYIQDCFGSNCLIVGYGSIGRDLALVLKSLNMNISAISRKKKSNGNLINKFYRLNDLNKIVKNYDYIINLLPINNETKDVFNLSVFKKMKNTCFYINVGRGETNDEKALYYSLKNKLIGGAALDVYRKEPLNSSSKLYKLKNIILSPHVACFSKKYWDRETKLFNENLDCYMKNQYSKMKNIIKNDFI